MQVLPPILTVGKIEGRGVQSRGTNCCYTLQTLPRDGIPDPEEMGIFTCDKAKFLAVSTALFAAAAGSFIRLALTLRKPLDGASELSYLTLVCVLNLFAPDAFFV